MEPAERSLLPGSGNFPPIEEGLSRENEDEIFKYFAGVQVRMEQMNREREEELRRFAETSNKIIAKVEELLSIEIDPMRLEACIQQLNPSQLEETLSAIKDEVEKQGIQNKVLKEKISKLEREIIDYTIGTDPKLKTVPKRIVDFFVSILGGTFNGFVRGSAQLIGDRPPRELKAIDEFIAKTHF